MVALFHPTRMCWAAFCLSGSQLVMCSSSRGQPVMCSSRGWAARPVGPAAPLPAPDEGGGGGGGGCWGGGRVEQEDEPIAWNWPCCCYSTKAASEIHLPPVRPPDDPQLAAGEGELPQLLPWHDQPCCQPNQEEEKEEAEKVNIWLLWKYFGQQNPLSGWHWAAPKILRSTKDWAEVHHRRKCKPWTWGSSWRPGWWERPTASLREPRRRRRRRWRREEMIEGFMIGSKWGRSGGDTWWKVRWEIPQIPSPQIPPLMQVETQEPLPRKPQEVSSN